MKLDRSGEVAILRMNAGKANAIGPAWLESMGKLEREAASSDARALVITGYESFFSAGLDLPALLKLTRNEVDDFIEVFDELMLRLFIFPRPVVAAINGHAVAGGCVLALQADQRLMTDKDCKIGLNEVVLGIGLPQSVIETLRCQVPSASLGPIALEGKLFSPKEAQAVGLVHDVLPAANLEERAVARARELGGLPSIAFEQIKRAIRRPIVDALRPTQRQERTRWVDTWQSPEAQARITAAVERLSKKK